MPSRRGVAVPKRTVTIMGWHSTDPPGTFKNRLMDCLLTVRRIPRVVSYREGGATETPP